MADPDGYEPQYDFSAYQAANPKRPLPGHELDVELHDISNAIGSTQTALADIRRSDGRLQNGIVDADAIGPTAVGALIEQSTELMEDVLFVVEMYLGQLAEDPETGRDGADLEPSNWYYSTVTEGYRYYTADGWRPMTGVATIRQYRFIMEAGQTDISGLDENGFQYFASGESVAVFKNGAILPKTTGFTTPDNSTITLASAASDGDVVVVLSFEEAVPAELGRLARRLHVADGTTATFALPTGVTSIGQVLSAAVDGVAQNYDTYSMVGSDLVLDAMPRNGERVQITAWTAVLAEDSNTRRAYAFATRAAFIAALGWPWESGAVVSDGTVQYEYLGTGTAISDAPGWVPFGAIYSEHWGSVGWMTGETASTADDTLKIKPAMDYAAGLRVALNFIGGKNYLLNTPLIGNVNHITLRSDSNKNSVIWVKADIDCGIDIYPINPTLSATAFLENVQLEGLTVYPRTPTSTAIGVRLRRVSGATTTGMILGGFFNAFKEEGCQNVLHNRIQGGEFNLNGAVANSAWYYRTGSLLDGTTWYNGFTTRFNGVQAGGGAQKYAAVIRVGGSDVIQITHGYFGGAVRGLLVKPDHASASVSGLSLNQVYFDGVANPSPQSNVVVDGNGFTAAAIQNIRFNHCVFGQAKSGFSASNGADLRSLSFTDCSFQNMDENPILIAADIGANLNLRVSNCLGQKWGMNTGGDTSKEIFGRVLKANSVSVVGSLFTSTPSAFAAWRFEGVTDLAYVANTHVDTTTMYTYSGGTQRVAASNTGDGIFSENTTTESTGTSPQVSLKFGGTAIQDAGGGYSSRAVRWYRTGNRVWVKGTITLSSKGSATGVASLTLPIAPVSAGVVQVGTITMAAMTSDALVPAYVLLLANGATEMEIRKYSATGAGGGTIITDTAFSGTANLTFEINYEVA